MGDQQSPYPPLTMRHKLIFAVASIAAIALAVALTVGRMAVIQWWLVNCRTASSQCDTARVVFEWWWLALILPVLALAGLAHWLTRDRLVRVQPANAA